MSGAKFVIAIISDGAGVAGNAYFERDFCLKELRWAKAAGRYIQPVVDGADKGRIGEFLGMAPDDLRDLGSVDFVDLNQTETIAPRSSRPAGPRRCSRWTRARRGRGAG